MSADPLDRLSRARQQSRPSGTHREEGGDHPIAPYWIGECLKCAGEAYNPSLILRQRGGNVTALSYSYLAATRFDGGESLEIDFIGYAVAVSGNRLRAVFEAVAAHNAMELAESKGEFDDGSDAPFIDGIDVVPTQER